jgi:hypothetical protein
VALRPVSHRGSLIQVSYPSRCSRIKVLSGASYPMITPRRRRRSVARVTTTKKMISGIPELGRSRSRAASARFRSAEARNDVDLAFILQPSQAE